MLNQTEMKPGPVRSGRPDFVRKAIEAQGFLLLPSFFGLEMIARLREVMDEARQLEELRFGREALREVGQLGYVSDILSWGKPMEELLGNSDLDEIVTSLMGEAHLYIGQGIYLAPGEGRGVWPRRWHADMFGVRREIGHQAFCFGVNCLVMIDEVTEENGPTCILPASHGMMQQRIDDEDLERMEFHATGPPGSLLLMDGGLWHCAGSNRSSSPRRVLKLLYTRKWIKPQIDYDAVISPEVRRRLNPAACRLLGINRPEFES